MVELKPGEKGSVEARPSGKPRMGDMMGPKGKRRMARILIVEDQELTLELLEFAVKKLLPKYFEEGSKYDVAKWYAQAEELIRKNRYDIVILDHRMPRTDPGCTDASDFNRFSATLQNIGYGLIDLIRETNPSAVIIGTSSLNPDELRHTPKPDYLITKSWGEAGQDLERIFKSI
jgi:CheY-like chemotaxis protein